jgi:hypothetical protein
MFCWALAFLGPTELTRARNYEITPHKVWLKDEALPCLDRDIPIAASDVLVAHLATRRWISDPDLLEVEPSGDPVACVVTDLSKEMDNWPLGIGGTEQLRKSLPERGYREAYRCGEFVVYERAGASCLRCTPKCG